MAGVGRGVGREQGVASSQPRTGRPGFPAGLCLTLGPGGSVAPQAHLLSLVPGEALRRVTGCLEGHASLSHVAKPKATPGAHPVPQTRTQL